MKSQTPKAKQALAKAVAAIYFADDSDYQSALWDIVIILGGKKVVDLLKNNEHKAYIKYGS